MRRTIDGLFDEYLPALSIVEHSMAHAFFLVLLNLKVLVLRCWHIYLLSDTLSVLADNILILDSYHKLNYRVLLLIPTSSTSL